MRISGQGTETFLFLNGIEVARSVRLGEQVHLLPAHCSADPDLILKLAKTDIDVGVAILSLNGVRSQIQVVADSPKELAARAWNTVWDGLLLGALFQCDAICNFQCSTSADRLSPSTRLTIAPRRFMSSRSATAERLTTRSSGPAWWGDTMWESQRRPAAELEGG